MSDSRPNPLSDIVKPRRSVVVLNSKYKAKAGPEQDQTSSSPGHSSKSAGRPADPTIAGRALERLGAPAQQSEPTRALEGDVAHRLADQRTAAQVMVALH